MSRMLSGWRKASGERDLTQFPAGAHRYRARQVVEHGMGGYLAGLASKALSSQEG